MVTLQPQKKSSRKTSKSRKKDKSVKVNFRNDSPYQTSHFLDIQKNNSSSGGKSSENNNTNRRAQEQSETPQFKMSVVSSRKGSTSPTAVHKLYQIPTGLTQSVTKTKKRPVVRKMSKDDGER